MIAPSSSLSPPRLSSPTPCSHAGHVHLVRRRNVLDSGQYVRHAAKSIGERLDRRHVDSRTCLQDANEPPPPPPLPRSHKTHLLTLSSTTGQYAASAGACRHRQIPITTNRREIAVSNVTPFAINADSGIPSYRDPANPTWRHPPSSEPIAIATRQNAL